MKHAAAFSALALALAVGSAAFAQQYEPSRGELARDPTYRRHLGFYIRPDLGFGYMAANQATTTYSGFAGLAGVAIGGAVRENSILAVHVFDAVVQNPSLSYGGSLQDSTMVLWGIGPQYTYYSQPTNIYVSTTVALTTVSVERPFGPRGATDVGLGTRVALGKEWWVGNHWGLGLVGHFSYSFNSDSGSTYTLTAYAVGLAFSATYN